LEAQKIFIQNSNDLTLGQLRRFKQRLLNSEQINESELQEICQVQAELSFLERKLEQEQKFPAQIEISRN
jgi:mevalonate kinase